MQSPLNGSKTPLRLLVVVMALLAGVLCVLEGLRVVFLLVEGHDDASYVLFVNAVLPALQAAIVVAVGLIVKELM